MATSGNGDDFDRLRRVHRVLVMHYVEGLSQAEIAKRTGMSHPTVNRLVKEGHERGYVNISISSPLQPLFEIEQKLIAMEGLSEAIVTPSISDQEDVNLATAGKAAADYLLSKLKDGDTICVSGGRGVDAVISALSPSRAYDVTVVPATGGVQGNFFTDVNHLAAQLARKLDAKAFQLHAPVFSHSREERDVLLSLQSVRDVLDRARNAAIALVGIGSVLEERSTYRSLVANGGAGKDLASVGAVGELIAHLIDRDGALCDYELNQRVIGLSLDELHAIPLTIGISSGARKALPIASVLRGGHLDVLATDEATGARILETMKDT
jgi:DNA-binding transcriptional regulator LsrR (DeoR family)